MARRVIRLDFGDGDSILVETEVDEKEPGYARAGTGDLVVKAPLKLQEALGPVTKTAELMYERMKASAHPPKDITLEFGIKFSVKGDVIIAGGEAEANCKLALKW